MLEQNDPRLVYVSANKAINPIDGSTALVNRWWIYLDVKGIVFYRPSPKSRVLYPQCNTNKECAESTRSRLYPWAQLMFLPVVFMTEES